MSIGIVCAAVAFFWPKNKNAPSEEFANIHKDSSESATNVITHRAKLSRPERDLLVVTNHKETKTQEHDPRQIVEEGELEGRVVDEYGKGVSGAWVHLIPKDAVQSPTRADGSFVFRHLHARRRYLVTAIHDELEQREVASVVADEGFVMLAMQRQIRFHGQLVSDDGSPIREFTINGIEVEDWLGRFDLPLRSNGMGVSITAESEGFEKRTEELPRQPELGKITLRRLPGIEGTVVDENGNPMPNAGVTCHPGPRNEGETFTDSAGKFKKIVFFGEIGCWAYSHSRRGFAKTVDAAPITIRLKHIRDITGEIRERNERPLGDFIVVRARSQDESRHIQCGWSASCRYSFGVVADKKWTIEVVDTRADKTIANQDVDLNREDKVLNFVVDLPNTNR